MNATSTSLKKIWQDAKSIVIIANTKSNTDVIFASLALLKYTNDNNKQCSLFSSELNKNKVFKHVVTDDIRQYIKSDLKPQITINLDNVDLNIDSVNLRKTDNGYQIVLNSDGLNNSSQIKPKVSNSTGTYDLAIVIGPPTLSLNIQDFAKKTFFITNQTNLAEKDNKDSISFKGSDKSFTMKTLEMFHIFEDRISADASVYILSGLLSYSAVFTKNISKNLFSAVQELITNGADYHLAHNFAVNNLTLKTVSLIGEGLAKVESHRNGLYACFIAKEQVSNSELKTKDLLKFNEIYNCKLALLFIEGSSLNKAYLKTSFKDVKLKTLLKAHKGKGSNYDGLILTDRDYRSFCSLLTDYLDSIK